MTVDITTIGTSHTTIFRKYSHYSKLKILHYMLLNALYKYQKVELQKQTYEWRGVINCASDSVVRMTSVVAFIHSYCSFTHCWHLLWAFRQYTDHSYPWCTGVKLASAFDESLHIITFSACVGAFMMTGNAYMHLN